MRIGFDAKRAFLNASGLGNYSRNMISYLAKQYPANEYILFTPKTSDRFHFIDNKSGQTVQPHNIFQKAFPYYWRSYRINKELQKHRLDIYHGLSNEIPYNIHKSSVKSVVTIHDLIFLRFPELYKPIDRNIYKNKFRYACNHADKIIAISEQTKQDIITFFGIDEKRISVVYQGCNPIFYQKSSQEEKKSIKKKFNLPDQFILSVGTIEERKNTLQIIKAIHDHHIDIPLVLAGRLTPYVEKIKAYIRENKMEKQVILLHEVETDSLPALYQMSEIFVYPSIFEGFGIPIIEALNSGIPVITTEKGCFSEAGGPDSLYNDPKNSDEIAEAITRILTDNNLKNKMIESGYQYTMRFREEKIAQDLMKVYEEIL
ncbi:MAG: glycosyltransferase family 4 protein [Bacteroidales bacterium]|nr:glycosyltransferase family 4 protein [Bacteroidales bacterium]